MKLAAIIDETGGLPFLEAVQNADDLHLTAVWTPDESLRNLLKSVAPDASFPPHWDRWLERAEFEAILVSGTSDEVLAAARQLFQTSRPLLVVTETTSGPARLFEFLPLWQEQPERVFPLFTSGVQQVAQHARKEFATGNHGELWKVELTRALSEEETGSAGLSGNLIDRWLFQDLQWICDLFGLPNHVTMQTSGPMERPEEATVLLGGANVPEIRWELQRNASRPGWQLRLTGTTGSTAAHSAGGDRPLLENNGESKSLPIEGTIVDDATRQLRSVSSQLAGTGTATSWDDVIRNAEIGAAARRSLQRRRTIEIHYEEVSERSQFKSQMSAIGCGALLWTIFGMISLLTLAGLFDPRDREYRTSAAAGYVLLNKDFREGSHELLPVGEERLRRIAVTWSSTSPVLVVEQDPAAGAQLNEAREAEVLNRLRKAGVRTPESRTVLRPLTGRWFETAMMIAWGVVFAPLGIVLALQLLIVVTRSQ